MLNSNARLVSIIRRLPISQQSPRLLNIGCGAFVEAPALRKLLPGWAVIGLDIVRLKKNSAWLIQADAVHLPFACKFGLILVRHPDVNKYPERWKTIFENLPAYLDGVLLVTAYTFDEIEFVRNHLDLPPISVSEPPLAPVDLVGRDKYYVSVNTK